MKNNSAFLVFILFVETLFGQILVRNENWPNPNWTVTGEYSPQALVSNPTLNPSLSYDTALVTPSGTSTLLEVTSPFFNLQPAFDGNEKFLKISFTIAYTTYANDVLYIEFWNADTSSWTLFPEGSAPLATVGDFKTCTFDSIYSLVNAYLDFSSFTGNQLQNFRYRFVVDGTSAEIAGVCVNSVFVSSLSCEAPTDLSLISVFPFQATINWTGNGSGTQYWEMEFGPKGFSLGTGMLFQTNSPAPYTIYGLTPKTSYDLYLRKDCSGFDQAVLSDWVGPLSFTTAPLGMDGFKLEGVTWFPNPTQGEVKIDALDAINEFKIINLRGQELMKIQNKRSSLNVDLSSFRNGLYVMRISTDKGTGVYKIIKN
ncbi:T9SS type A sorting domain-containing protein [Flavobacterium psychrotolerans]|uniref:Fibronectin type-III domain-containing protein n=1 Tax=Flavobacterium psychrotolerans TaxID=2169410 RepID=A0A2U1JGL2_9FLAO|nr:T9SS type A sorting domain-containing protein [Flavobacterium psychrotolerans]PWA04013.1 hypothetical protein DB895_13310 [Flavobacterium psychrotolerans]